MRTTRSAPSSLRPLRWCVVSALLLMIAGCATALKQEIPSSHPVEGWNQWSTKNTIVENYDDIGYKNPDVLGQGIFKVEAINLETGEKFHVGVGEYAAVAKQWALVGCSYVFNSDCVVSRINDSIIYADIDDYRESQGEQRQATEEQRLAVIHALEEQRQVEEQQRLAVIHALQDRCISYGFTGDNNIAACIQREAQHDLEIEQQEHQLRLAQQQLQARSNQGQVIEDEIPWWGLILGGIVEGIGEGYKNAAIINALDSRYERRSNDIWRYCRPNC